MNGTEYELFLPEPISDVIGQITTAENELWWRVGGPGISQPPGGLRVPVVFVRLGFTRDPQQLVCTGLLIAGQPATRHGGPVPMVTTRGARIPLAKILEAARRELGDNPRTKKFRGLVEQAVKTGAPPAFRVRLGPSGHPDSHYREVAERYRAALRGADSSAPTKALIAQYSNYSPATVRYWLSEARRRGYLGRSERGRAGEHRPRVRRGGRK